MKPQIWEGCYDSGWKGFITPASFAHPAKFARGLIERIFDHCLAKGYLKRGDVCGDAFGGIGTGGIIAAYRGLEWVGCELESKFVGLAQDNFELHRSKLAVMGLPFPRIIQGDSRQFHLVIGGANGIVSSPPYAQTNVEKNSNGVDLRKNFETYKVSGGGCDFEGYKAIQEKHSQGYGESDGQIAALKEGSVSGVISSPPYAVIITGAGGLNTKPPKHAGQQSGRSAKAASQDTDQKYGQAAVQIAALKEGSVDGVISSPPYADTTRGNDACGIDWDKAAPTKKTSGRHHSPGMSASTEYGQSAGQIGALKSGSVDGVVSSPPYISGGHHPDQTGAWGGLASRKGFADKYTAGYGVEKGQIGKLQPGDVQAVVTSPPRGKNVEGSRKISKMGSPEKILACSRGHGASDAAVIAQAARDEQKIYGESPGQIGKLKGGSLDGVCTIPPYDCKDDKGNRSAAERDCRRLGITREEWDRRYRTCHKGGVLYGETAGQIGQLSATNGPETYWQAMDAVYRSCYQVIKPGGVIVLVVKDYVKGGKRVPLCDDTVRLIEHIGFTMVERIHAMLVKETRHGDLFTGETVSKTERKSFFRRLHEKKPNAVKIDWEEVLIARRP